MPALVIFPHQLFQLSVIGYDFDYSKIILVEHPLFFGDSKYPFKFHKKKLILHRASMQAYKDYLEHYDKEVIYLGYKSVHKIGSTFKEMSLHTKEIIFFDPVDYILEKRIKKYGNKYKLTAKMLDTPYFLNTKQENKEYFSKNKFYQHHFYIHQRKKLEVLLEPDGSPKGGKWSYDSDNRKKLPKNIQLPNIPNYKDSNQNYIQEAKDYVESNFPNNPGVTENFFYPINHKQAKDTLHNFLEKRLSQFGDYEDAIDPDQNFIFHSLLSAPLNCGLITPEEVLEETLNYASKHKVPLNSLEGFIRQIISWREFMRATYDLIGVEVRNKNFWNHTNTLPKSLYSATTGLYPVDKTIQKVLNHAYCHHIERLMVLGNIMCLLEIHPTEVYNWFMELFIDAYDWVMVTNVYSMSQFADGGMITTKPYISSSNYIKKMSSYSKGEWESIWTDLYWNFIHKHRAFFEKNYRLKMMVSHLDKMPKKKLDSHIESAQNYISSLQNS